MNFAFATEAREAAKKINPVQTFLMRRRGKKVYIGHEQREGWSGKLPFYLFWCDACSHYAQDYPHGHIERQYLLCSHCDERHDFVPWWVAWVQALNLLRFAIQHRQQLRND